MVVWRHIMQVTAIQTSLFSQGENLIDFIVRHISHIDERSILVVTSKIVALAEGRVASVSEKESLIKTESDWQLHTSHVWLTLRQGALLTNAGIDESNAFGGLILLPEDAYHSAEQLRDHLRAQYRVADLGVLITDSRPCFYGQDRWE